MAKQYRIDAVINNRQAVQAARALNAELQKVDRAAQRALSRAQAATNAAATAINRSRPGGGGGGGGGSGSGGGRTAGSVEDRYLLREYQGRVAHQRRLEQAQDRHLLREYNQRVAYERRKQQEAARAAARATSSKEREAAQVKAVEDRYARQEYSRRVAYERRKEIEAIRAANRAVAIKDREASQKKAVEDRWLRREQRDRVAFERRRQQNAAANAEDRQARTETAIWTGGTAAIAAAGKALAFFLEQIDRVREKAMAEADQAHQMRRDIRMEAALNGDGRTTNQALASNLEFRMRTGLDQGGASDFVRQFEGSLPIGKQKKNITDQTAAELKVAAGIRANRLGGDMSTHGDLAGILGQYGKVESSKAGLSQLEAVRYALTAGRGDDPILTRQLLKAAGSTVREGGAVGTLPEMAALIGVTSLSAGPEEAGTRAEQLVRGLRSGLTKQAKAKGAKSSQANYLRKKLGIDEKDNLETMLDKIVPDLEKAKAAGRDLDVYLAENGFRSFEERRALIEVTENYKPLKERFDETRKRATTFGDQEEQRNRDFLASTEGRRTVAEASGDATNIAEGLKGERWAALLKEAEASPEFQTEERSTLTGFKDFGMGLITGHVSSPVGAGRQSRLEGHAYDILKKRAMQSGVSEDELYEAWGQASRNASRSKQGFTDVGRDQEYANLVESLIQQKGGAGANAVDTAPAMRELKDSIDKLRGAFEKQNGQGQKAPAPLPGAPRGGAVRP